MFSNSINLSQEGRAAATLMPPTSIFRDALYDKFRASYQVLGVCTPEESRCLLMIEQAGWRMAHGRDYDVTFEEQETLEAVFAEPRYAAYVCALNGQLLTVDVDRLGGLLRQLAYEADDDSNPAAALLARARIGHIRKIMTETGWPLVTWDVLGGFSTNNSHGDDLTDALLAVGDASDRDLPLNCVVVFRDSHLFLNTDHNPRWRRALRHLSKTTW